MAEGIVCGLPRDGSLAPGSPYAWSAQQSMGEEAMSIAAHLGEEGRAALGEFLLLLADDELVLGHRDSQWSAVAPLLEEDVALTSIAQDEISHAALFYELASSLRGKTPDQLAFGRQSSAFRNAALLERENGDWAFSIARHYVYDIADNLRIGIMLRSGESILRAVAERLQREERYHLEHGQVWVRRLSEGCAESRRRLQHAVDRVAGDCYDIFQPLAWEYVLVAEGVLPQRTSQLYGVFVETVRAAFSQHGIGFDPPAVPGHARGRMGEHTPELRQLLATMGEVWRSDPAAAW